MTFASLATYAAPAKARSIVFSTAMIRKILSGEKVQTRRILDESRLRVRLPHTVRSDFSEFMPNPMRAQPGTYPAEMNQHGAVSLKMDWRTLGVKPGEFHFVCPYADGDTHLANHGGDRKVWTITPTGSNRLWVKEAWHTGKTADHLKPSELPAAASVQYLADFDPGDHLGNQWGRYRHARFMPRALSRIELLVTSVRVERLHAITEKDAKAEGVTIEHGKFRDLKWRKLADDAGPHAHAFGALWTEINGAESWDRNPWTWAISFQRVRP